ncbi:hypothetical protein E2I00_019670 [Balaenoptera physalus]|uniref:PB1 domain-containing protein n=1 Tax=Balaenoptera physalus TaxID=9770 RepID=A0A6A1QA01_BALPH|nr:hypothetical protein E2I00_019670 [Balaenoptera physalus]
MAPREAGPLAGSRGSGAARFGSGNQVLVIRIKIPNSGAVDWTVHSGPQLLFRDVLDVIGQVLPEATTTAFEYEDEDGDRITVRSDEEMKAMLSYYYSTVMEQQVNTRAGSSQHSSPAVSDSLPSNSLKKSSAELKKILANGQMNEQDIRYRDTLGHGNGGTVYNIPINRAYHVPSGKILAVKVILLDITLELQKQIMSELEILYKCDSSYIIGFYGAFFVENRISICTEFMDDNIDHQLSNNCTHLMHLSHEKLFKGDLWMYIEKFQSMSLEELQWRYKQTLQLNFKTYIATNEVRALHINKPTAPVTAIITHIKHKYKINTYAISLEDANAAQIDLRLEKSPIETTYHYLLHDTDIPLKNGYDVFKLYAVLNITSCLFLTTFATEDEALKQVLFCTIKSDVKPSNMLVNTRGQVKLCDFGVSTQLVNSIAKTYVGTNAYMARTKEKASQSQAEQQEKKEKGEGAATHKEARSVSILPDYDSLDFEMSGNTSENPKTKIKRNCRTLVNVNNARTADNIPKRNYLALGRFPYPQVRFPKSQVILWELFNCQLNCMALARKYKIQKNQGSLMPLQLLQCIVDEDYLLKNTDLNLPNPDYRDAKVDSGPESQDSPVLPVGEFSEPFVHFITQCMRKQPKERPAPEELMPILNVDLDSSSEVLADISYAFGYSFGGAHQLIGQGTPNLQGETLDGIETSTKYFLQAQKASQKPGGQLTTMAATTAPPKWASGTILPPKWVSFLRHKLMSAGIRAFTPHGGPLQSSCAPYHTTLLESCGCPALQRAGSHASKSLHDSHAGSSVGGYTGEETMETPNRLVHGHDLPLGPVVGELSIRFRLLIKLTRSACIVCVTGLEECPLYSREEREHGHPFIVQFNDGNATVVSMSGEGQMMRIRHITASEGHCTFGGSRRKMLICSALGPLSQPFTPAKCQCAHPTDAHIEAKSRSMVTQVEEARPPSPSPSGSRNGRGTPGCVHATPGAQRQHGPGAGRVHARRVPDPESGPPTLVHTAVDKRFSANGGQEGQGHRLPRVPQALNRAARLRASRAQLRPQDPLPGDHYPSGERCRLLSLSPNSFKSFSSPDPAALAAAPCRCAQPFARAFHSGFRNSVPFLGSPFSWLRGPEPPPPLGKTPGGLQTVSLGRTRSAQDAPFTACGQGTLADFGKPRRHHHFPEPWSPRHLPSLRTLKKGAEELGQCFCLLKCCKGLQRKRRELQPYSGSSALKPNQVGETSLYGVPIVSLVIDGQERLCLAQISNTLLKNYSYNEIHNRRVALGITCVQCTPLPENFAFDVVHECAWGSRGSFIPARYNSSRAKCIKCGYCSMYFSPNKFIFHSHRTPDAKYTQPDAANFNSWRRHLKLSDKSATDELSHAWEDVYAPEREEHVKSAAAALGPAASYLCTPEAHEPDKEDNHSTADDLETRKSYPDQRSISQPSPANTDRGEDGLTLDVTGTQLVEKDIENLARDELQKLLLEQMELRKKLEREFQSLKDNFQDQMKRELAYREEMVQQLQIVRDTLCNELDQERKARYAIQQKLKEAHDALHHFSCKMLTPRHCTGNCSFKPPLLP